MVSSQKRSITSRLSTPRRLKTRPSSLANETLVAWKALQAYLSASAVRGCTTRIGAVEEGEELRDRVDGT